MRGQIVAVFVCVCDDLVTCTQCNLILLTQGLAMILHTCIEEVRLCPNIAVFLPFGLFT